MVPACIYCDAKRFQYEPPTFFCANGYIKLARIEAPAELYELFMTDTEEATGFHKNIRACNSIFAFISFGVTLDKDMYITIYHHWYRVIIIFVTFNYTSLIQIMSWAIGYQKSKKAT